MGNDGTPGSGTNFVSNDLPTANSMSGGIDGPAAGNDDYINAANKFKNADEVDVSLILSSDQSSTVVRHLVNNIAEDRKDAVV